MAGRAESPADPSAAGVEPGAVLDAHRRDAERRFKIRRRAYHAETGARAAAAGACRAAPPVESEKGGFRNHRSPEIASSGALSEPAPRRAFQAQAARGCTELTLLGGESGRTFGSALFFGQGAPPR